MPTRSHSGIARNPTKPTFPGFRSTNGYRHAKIPSTMRHQPNESGRDSRQERLDAARERIETLRREERELAREHARTGERLKDVRALLADFGPILDLLRESELQPKRHRERPSLSTPGSPKRKTKKARATREQVQQRARAIKRALEDLGGKAKTADIAKRAYESLKDTDPGFSARIAGDMLPRIDGIEQIRKGLWELDPMEAFE